MKPFFNKIYIITAVFSIALLVSSIYCDSEKVHQYMIPYTLINLPFIASYFFFDLITKSFLKIEDGIVMSICLLICYVLKIWQIFTYTIIVSDHCINLNFITNSIDIRDWGQTAFYGFIVSNMFMFVVWVIVKIFRN